MYLASRLQALAFSPIFFILQISMQDVTQFYHYPKEQVESLINEGLYPSRIRYLVSHTDASNPAPLECKIVVKGAEINGEQLYFMLTLPSQTLTTSTCCKCFREFKHLHDQIFCRGFYRDSIL